MKHDLCYFVVLPMALFSKGPQAFIVASQVSLAATAATAMAVAGREKRLRRSQLVALILVHVVWAVITGFETVVMGVPRGDPIRLDLVLLAPVVWLLVLTQAVVLVRWMRS